MDVRSMITPWLESTEMKDHRQRLTLRIPTQISPSGWLPLPICSSRWHLLKRGNSLGAKSVSPLTLGKGGTTRHREEGEYKHKRDASPNDASLVAKHGLPHSLLSFRSSSTSRETFLLWKRRKDFLVSSWGLYCCSCFSLGRLVSSGSRLPLLFPGILSPVAAFLSDLLSKAPVNEKHDVALVGKEK